MGTYDYHGFCRDLLRTVLIDSKEILPDLKPSAFDITKSSLGGYEIRLTSTRFYHYANSACCVWSAKAEAIEHLTDQQTELDEDLRAAFEEEQRIHSLSIDAWYKLWDNPRYRPLCDEWNEFANRPSALALKSQLSADREFMKLYTYATRGATTTSTKRQALRACLDYYNFMWRHREPAAIEPEPYSVAIEEIKS